MRRAETRQKAPAAPTGPAAGGGPLALTSRARDGPLPPRVAPAPRRVSARGTRGRRGLPAQRPPAPRAASRRWRAAPRRAAGRASSRATIACLRARLQRRAMRDAGGGNQGRLRRAPSLRGRRRALRTEDRSARRKEVAPQACRRAVSELVPQLEVSHQRELVRPDGRQRLLARPPALGEEIEDHVPPLRFGEALLE